MAREAGATSEARRADRPHRQHLLHAERQAGHAEHPERLPQGPAMSTVAMAFAALLDILRRLIVGR